MVGRWLAHWSTGRGFALQKSVIRYDSSTATSFGRVPVQLARQGSPGVNTVKQLKLKKIVLAVSLAWSSVALVVPTPAEAAGLGRLTVQSGLGQPLRAEIDLTSVSREEASSLSARLASPDAYRQAGVEYNPSLLGVRMTVDRRPDGGYFIRLSSNQPINEPIVDALVELNWANGRLVREYTFLLDPVDMRPPQTPVTAPEPKPEPKPPAAAPAPVATPTPVARPAPTPAPVRPSEPPKSGGVTGSYDVKKGDTLGKIARQAQTDGVSIDQMMIALQRANQDAFVGGNINRLKSGVILNIPDKEAAASVTPSDASRLVIAQSSDWKAYQDKVAGGVQTAPAPAAKPEAAKKAVTGKITAKVEDKSAPKPTADQLKLSKPDPAAAAAKPGAKPKASEEDRVAKEREARDAKAREAELKRNVEDLKKLAEVKSAPLADAQKQAQAKVAAPQVAQGPVVPVPVPAPAKAEAPKVAAAAPAASAPPAAPVAAPAPTAAKALEPPKAAPPAPVPAAPAKAPEPPKAAEPAKAADATKPADAPKPADPAKADAAKTEPAKAPAAPAGDARKGDAPKTDAPKADAPKADAPKADAPKADAKPAPKKAAVPPPPPPPEPSLVDEFLGNPLYLAGGGGVLALLGGYAAFAVRRKRKDAATGFENSIVTGGDLKANSVFGNTGGQSIDTGNSSFQSDFSQPGAAAALESDEVDPVAEADVYMAYGRDAQAEEILKEALQKDPNRQTVRLKLLEIYNQRGDVASFGSNANVLHAATGGQGEQWTKAAAMGQQIDPSNPLYGGAGAAVNAGGDSVSTVALGAGALAAAASAAAVAASDGGDKTVTMPAFGGAAGAAAFGAAADDPMTKTVALDAMQGKTPAPIDLDFDLGTDASAAPGQSPDLTFGNTSASKNAAPSVDFDLGFGDAAPTPAAAPVAAIDTDFAPGGTLIIDAPVAMEALNAASDKTQELNNGALKAPAEDAGMSVDFDFDLGASAPAAAAPAAAGGGVDFDFGSLSLELPGGEGSAAPDAPADDVATKLDLAKAYQEMGDKDGARELLKEVLAEGSDAQKADAQNLMAALG